MTKIEALELERAARKMVEGTELDWWKVIKCKESASKDMYGWAFPRVDVELALGIIEGAPVWPGYKHFDSRGECHIAGGKYTQAYLDTCSWNPPKPKTVMIELTVEDAKVLFLQFKNSQISNVWDRVSTACRKALEDLK